MNLPQLITIVCMALSSVIFIGIIVGGPMACGLLVVRVCKWIQGEE